MNSNQQHQTIYTPYCYLIGWSKLNKFYYGVRHSIKVKCLYESGCHPDDLWVKYFTSSLHVKQYRAKYGEPDIIQVRKTFTTAEKAVKWEEKVLKRVLIKNRDKFLNKGVSGSIVNKGRKLSDETKRKISEARKDKGHTLETRLQMSKDRKGKPGKERTIETRRKISETRKKKGIGIGVKFSEERRCKMSEVRKGKPGRKHTEETRRKMSESRKGRPLSEEHKVKLRKIKRSDETKRKISLTRSLRYKKTSI